MQILWDPAKGGANLQKHGVHFSDAEGVLFDPLALTIEDSTAMGEARHISTDADSLGRILIVVHAYRGNLLRLISAREATRKERLQYEEGV